MRLKLLQNEVAVDDPMLTMQDVRCSYWTSGQTRLTPKFNKEEKMYLTASRRTGEYLVNIINLYSIYDTTENELLNLVVFA